MPFNIVDLLEDPNNIVITGGLNPTGAYNNATNYQVGDSVDYGGSSYVMYNDAVAGTLPTNTTYWQLLASKGDTGTTGTTGQGVPSGGTTGQILSKQSNTNYDTEWVANTGGTGISEEVAIAYSVSL